MQQDPTVVMADQLVRILVINGLQALCWLPLVYLHARWSRKAK